MNALILGRAFRGEFRRTEDRHEAPENMICGPIRLSSNRGLVSICTIGPVVDRVMGLIRNSDRRPLFTDRAYKRHSSPVLSIVSIKSKSPSISTSLTTMFCDASSNDSASEKPFEREPAGAVERDHRQREDAGPGTHVDDDPAPSCRRPWPAPVRSSSRADRRARAPARTRRPDHQGGASHAA